MQDHCETIMLLFISESDRSDSRLLSTHLLPLNHHQSHRTGTACVPVIFAPHLLILNLTSCHILHQRHGQGSCSPSTHLIPLVTQQPGGNVFMG